LTPRPQTAAKGNTYSFLGDGIACANLSDAYAQGKGVTADPAKALELRKAACEKGFTDACKESPSPGS
jgi:TPR repeat protein